jgi:hypothetical protein
VLPRNGWVYAIIIGGIGGIIAFFVPMGITYANASLFNQAVRLDQSMPLQVTILTSLSSLCGSPVSVGLAIAFVVGMITGRITVNRWLRFLAGTFAGASIALYYIITAYIPGYPGHISSSTTTITPLALAAGIVVDLILMAFWAAVGGSVSFVGAWITTRTHPYNR